MKDRIVPPEFPPPGAIPERPWDRWARGRVLALLGRLERGRLVLEEGGTTHAFGERSAAFPLEARLFVHHPRFYGDCLFGGTIGAGESYMAGCWSAEDPAAVVRVLVLNPEVFGGLDSGPARLFAPALKIAHWLNRNTRRGSRRNIVAHYDLGNEFYALFLDETLTYSCGIFENPESTLREASIAKYERICRKLRLSPADRVLEIGSGWGGFAIHAASRFGCRVTTTTISDRQFELARRRIREAGLEGRIELLKRDYRDLTGRFDKLVSIEMIEAVGHDFLETFFRVAAERLEPDGMMLLQAITIRDQVFERHKRSVDFIKRYIFPGSCIPSIAAMAAAVARATDLKIVHLEDLTPHYVRTLRAWRENLLAHRAQVRALGFPESFLRMWEFYLAYCEGGFAERYLGDVQMLLAKPGNRAAPLLPRLD
ncbi:MAG: cyclopropane-fatty-acyl-phospholipid synthase family protein [Desulfobacterales bacterium]